MKKENINTKKNIELRDVELTLNMWGVSKSTIYRLRRNVRNSRITNFKNGMAYNPITKEFK